MSQFLIISPLYLPNPKREKPGEMDREEEDDDEEQTQGEPNLAKNMEGSGIFYSYLFQTKF